MKKILIFLLVFNLVHPLMATTNCECGEHATGITTYIVDGALCCSSPVLHGSVGYEYGYSWCDGAWAVTSTTQITAQAAKDKCCPNP